MSVGAASLPVGVRAVTGSRAGRLIWTSSGGLELEFDRGDRVLVRDGEATWLGEVVVPSVQVLEAVQIDLTPVIERRITEADAWPDALPSDGRRLLQSLELSADQTRPSSHDALYGPI